MTYELALAEDRAGHVEHAATAYEEALANNPPTPAILMNLVTLYWQSTEYGFWTANRLSHEFVASAGVRFGEWLERSLILYPSAAEPRFWKKYIAWVDLGQPLSVEECRELLSMDSNALVPAMHLYALSQGEECADQAATLLEQCKADGTTRARYVASVIEGVSKRRRARPSSSN